MAVPQSARAGHACVPATRHEALRALSEALTLLGTPGTGTVIAALGDGPATAAEVRARVAGLGSGDVERCLWRLCADGLVRRTGPAAASPEDRYALAAPGRALLIPIAAVLVWAQDHLRTGMPPVDGTGRGEPDI
ncbi:hypothetical protein ACFU3O_14690 [Streptomyces antibioticus]|uniref:hypothetical protein n=1 Tax=Streptomyces antibioticus TaxID=1890 RepID=UPI0036A5E34E